MTRIDRFHVDGLAGRKKSVEGTLHPQVTIFFGLNGTGKTSLLRVFASALKNESSDLSGVPFESANLTIYSHSKNKSSEYRIAKPDKKKGTEVPEEFSLFVSTPALAAYERLLAGDTRLHTVHVPEWKQTPHIGSLSHAFLQTSRLLIGNIQEGGPVPSLTDAQLNSLFERTLEREWLKYWGNLQSELRKKQELGLQRIVREMISSSKKQAKASQPSSSPELAFDQISAFLRRNSPDAQLPRRAEFNNQLATDPLFGALIGIVQQVEEQLQELMRPISVLSDLLAKMFSAEKRPVFGPTSITITSGSGELRPSQLSSGEKHLLRILFTAMLSRDRACVLIDEPEISLHIDWQRALVAALTEIAPSCQFIIATHSPEIMADVPDEQIIAL